MASSAPSQWPVRPVSANAAEPVTADHSKCPPSRPTWPLRSPQSADATQQAAATTSCRPSVTPRPPRPPRRPRRTSRGQAKAEAKKKAEAARKAAAEARRPLRRARTQRLHAPPSAPPARRRRTSAAHASGSVGDRHRLPQGAARRRLRHGRHRPQRVGLLRPGPGRVQAGRRRPAARLAGPVDGRHPGLAVATSRSATSCTGVARAGVPRRVSTSATASTWTRPTPSKGVVIQDLSGYPATARCACSEPVESPVRSLPPLGRGFSGPLGHRPRSKLAGRSPLGGAALRRVTAASSGLAARPADGPIYARMDVPGRIGASLTLRPGGRSGGPETGSRESRRARDFDWFEHPAGGTGVPRISRRRGSAPNRSAARSTPVDGRAGPTRWRPSCAALMPATAPTEDGARAWFSADAAAYRAPARS